MMEKKRATRRCSICGADIPEGDAVEVSVTISLPGGRAVGYIATACQECWRTKLSHKVAETGPLEMILTWLGEDVEKPRPLQLYV